MSVATAMSVAGIVLAAGRSSRAGRIKALAELDGKAFVQRCVDSLLEGGCHAVVVVVGPPHEDVICDVLRGAQTVRNPDPDRGMLSSLQCGLGSLDVAERAGSVVVALVDQPRVAASTVASLISAAARSRAAWLRPVHAGKSGHPFLIRGSAIEVLCAAPPEQRVRDVLHGVSTHSVAVADRHVLEDIDTPADFARLQ